MKHLAKVLLCIMLATTLLFAISACSDDEESSSRFPNTQSGFKFNELSEAVLDISQSFELKDEKNGYIPGAEVEVSVEGYSELSYYDAKVIFTWNYEFLNDNGEYEASDYEVEVELDPMGMGSLDKKVEFTEHRSIRKVELALTFEGYAIKK